MNKSLTKPLIRPLGGRWARVCLTALLTAVVTVGAQARATCESGTRACADSLGGAHDRTAVEGGTPSRTAGDIVLTPPRDLNSELRHRTWSVYTQGGLSWATGGASISNDDAITITGNVRTTNRHERFNTFYIPASLHVEADLCRRLTVGLKGEADWLLNRGDIAPKGYAFALVTLRYNLVPSRARVQRAYYEGEISALGGRLDALRLEADRSRARADEAEEALRLAETQNADLQGLLSDCEECRARAEAVASAAPTSHFVQFDHNSSYVGDAEADRLRAFARSVRGERLSLVAEASTPGGEDYNVRLSERRLRRVVEILVSEGLSAGDLRPATAIGARNGKPSAEGRRVTITVVKE